MEQPTTRTPFGWHIAGTVRTAYVAGIDPNVKMGPDPSGYLKSTKRRIDGFGTLMQSMAPDRYAGGRIRVSCYLKTADVAAWAGLWVRVDRGRGLSPIAFDNMEDRAIRGSTDWTECVIVLDVGERASNIAFGVLLSGTGTVWIDRLKFEAVGDDVPLTSAPLTRNEPRNLGFDETPGAAKADEADKASQSRRAVSDLLRTVVGKRPKEQEDLRCSFCHKSADAVEKLIVGGGNAVHICNECVALCVEVLASQPKQAAQ